NNFSTPWAPSRWKMQPSRKEPILMNNQPVDPLLMDHEADGIQELDNKLPRWWVWLFYITIFFGVLYFGYYHVLHMGDLQAAQYEKEWKQGEEIKAAALAKFEASIGTLQPSKDAAVLDLCHKTFLKMFS